MFEPCLPEEPRIEGWKDGYVLYFNGCYTEILMTECSLTENPSHYQVVGELAIGNLMPAYTEVAKLAKLH